jgi:PAS domain S-box-containing protein
MPVKKSVPKKKARKKTPPVKKAVRSKAGTTSEVGERTRELSKVNQSLLNEIAERKEEEKALQRERDLLQDVMNGANNSHLVYLDRNFNFVRVNEVYAATCGYRPEEMIGKNHFALYPHAGNEAIFARVRDTGEAIEVHDKPFEFPDQPGRGVTYWDWTLTPVKDPAGNVEGLVFSLHETTARKRAEEALASANERLQKLLEILPIGIAIAEDAQCHAVTLNNLSHKLLESDRQNNVSATAPGGARTGIRHFLQGRELLPHELPLQRAVAEGREFQGIELDILLESGRRITVSLNATPLRDAEGKVIGGIATMVDITQRKQVEETLRATSERYRSYVDVTGQLGWTTDVEGEVVEDLPSWRSFTGQTYDEIRGRGWSKALHPDDRTHVTQTWKKAVIGRSKYEFEYRIRRHDGIYRYFMARGIPVFNEEGSIREWVGTCIDITERKRAEESLKTALTELERRAFELEAVNRELEAFSYTVSHDLKSPLRSIDGFARALLEDYADKLDATGKDYLVRVNAAGLRMNQLIDAMLNMARLTRGELHEKTVDLGSLAHVVARNLQKRDPKRQVELTISEDVKAKGDQDMLMIVLQNLLDNSWKFTSKHPSAKIEFGAVESGGRTVYFVRDDGAGFDMQFTDKLFMPFKRFHSDAEFPGLGIGLAIVHRIILRHNGRIWAESAPEKGTTFFFSL